MCGTGDMFCFGLMNNANLITDMLDNQDSYNVISCVAIVTSLIIITTTTTTTTTTT